MNRNCSPLRPQGPANVRVGEVQARESLQQSVREACAAAGVTSAQVVRTCVGGSGAAHPELAEVVRRCLAESNGSHRCGRRHANRTRSCLRSWPGRHRHRRHGFDCVWSRPAGKHRSRRGLGIFHRGRRFRTLDWTHRRQRGTAGVGSAMEQRRANRRKLRLWPQLSARPGE